MNTFLLSSGDTIPGLGFGTWQIPEELAYRCVKQALHCGYHHIDCAEIYRNENSVGLALNEYLNEQNNDREALWVTSKLWNSYHAPEEVAPAVKRTLNSLRLDYLDLYLIHWPVAFTPHIGLGSPTSADGFLSLDSLPLQSTWQAMETLVSSGLVKNIGVSNFSVSQLQAIIDCATIAPVINQVESHPHFPQHALQAFCTKHDIHVSAYSPLGSGIRPQALEVIHEPGLLSHPVINTIAKAYQATPAQILLAWQLIRGFSALTKSENFDHIRDNLIAADLVLSDETMQQIHALDKNCRYSQGQFCWRPQGSPYHRETFWQ